MAMSDNETLRVRAEPPRRGGLFWLAWRQQVMIGGEGETGRIIHLKARRLYKIIALRDAIEQVVLTHEEWNGLQYSSTRFEDSDTLKKLVLTQNREANTLLFKHGIRLKGFILSEPTIKHAR